MKKTIQTMVAAAVLLLSMGSCSDNAPREKNLFTDVAAKMQKRMEYALKSMDKSLSESERAKYAEKERAEFNEALDIAENLGDCQLPGATDDEFGLTLKGPFKVFMFNREDGCFYLQAPAEMDQDTRNFYAIGYADDTPVYYIDGAEGIDDEGHLQMVMLTGEEEGAEDTEYLQVKLMIRLVDSEQLAKINRIVLTQNEEIFQKLKDETAQREKDFHEKATKTNKETADDGNLIFMGISLGQTPSEIVAQLKEKGFKTVQTNKYMIEMQGDVYGKQASVTVETTDDQKIIVSVRDLKPYTLKQAQQRLDELQPHFQRGEEPLVLAFDTMEGSRLMQKGGKIDLYYYNEDEVEGTSDYYIVAVKLCNQDFNEE